MRLVANCDDSTKNLYKVTINVLKMTFVCSMIHKEKVKILRQLTQVMLYNVACQEILI